jgi:hypothetical protein
MPALPDIRRLPRLTLYRSSNMQILRATLVANSALGATRRIAMTGRFSERTMPALFPPVASPHWLGWSMAGARRGGNLRATWARRGGGKEKLRVAFPRPFELGTGSKLFFVGHGTPRSPKIGMRVISPRSCKIGLTNHSRIWPEQIELFVFRSLLEQSCSASSTCWNT